MARGAAYSLPINRHAINRFLGGTLALTQAPEFVAGLVEPVSADPCLEQQTPGFQRYQGMGVPNRETPWMPPRCPPGNRPDSQFRCFSSTR